MAKVLVVDDDEINLKVAAKILGKENLVETELDPLETIEREDLETFDVIVLDYRMPGMTGVTLKEKMQEMGVTAPFIAWSAHFTKSQSGEFYKEGFYELVPKPFEDDELLDAVRNAVGAEPCSKCQRKIKMGEGRYLVPGGSGSICILCGLDT